VDTKELAKKEMVYCFPLLASIVCLKNNFLTRTIYKNFRGRPNGQRLRQIEFETQQTGRGRIIKLLVARLG
jgi:hypothetical protein